MNRVQRSIGSLKNYLFGWVNRIIIPHPSIVEIGARRQAQFSAAIALFLSVMLFLQIIAALATGRLDLGMILGIVYGGVLVGYGLSRGKHPQWGAVLLIFGFTLVAFILSGRSESDINTTMYGMIPIAYVLAGVLLSSGWQVALVLFVLAGSMVLSVTQNMIGVNMNMLGGNLVALGVLLIFTSKLRDGIERRRLDQVRQINAELENIKLTVQESEQKFRTFVEQSSDGLLLTDEQGIIIEHNLAHERLTGIKRDEIIGQPIWDLLVRMIAPEARSGDTRQSFMEMIRNALHTGQGQFIGKSREVELIRPDGTRAFLLQTVFLIKTELGYRFGSITHDVTDRKHADEALRESESRFRSFVEKTSDGIMFFDSQGQVIEWNNAVEQLTGLDRQKALGMHAWDIQYQFTPDDEKRDFDLERVRSIFLSTFHTGSIIPSAKDVREARIQHVDGSVRIVEQRVFPIKTAQGFALGAVLHDVTERKYVENLTHLRLSLFEFAAHHPVEELLQKTLDEVGKLTNSPIGFYHFVSEDQKTLILQAWSTRTMMEFCRAEGKESHYPIDQAGVWADSIRQRQVIIHNDYSSLPNRKGMPDGHAVVTRELVVPILRNDRVVAVLGVGNKPQEYTDKDAEFISYIADVTWELVERRQADLEREALIGKLELQNAELERFNYTVSHDLKTPLVTIKGFLGYILEDAVTGNVNRLKQDVQRIARAVDRMNNLLKDLLEFSRSGQLINPTKDIPFESLVREAMEQTEERIKERGIKLVVHQGLPSVHGDADRLLEVLQNLLDNAAKFMGNQREPIIEIGCMEQDGKHVFFVQDNGVGIDPRFHDQVFGLFNKLDPQVDGTGVGLALVKRIVEFHGGRIWLDSEPGRGSTFYFTLPAALQQEEAGQ